MTLLRRRLAFGEAFIKRSIWFWDFFENGTGFRDCLVLLKGEFSRAVPLSFAIPGRCISGHR